VARHPDRLEVLPDPPDLHGRSARADAGFAWAARLAGGLVLAILALIAVSTVHSAWPAFRHEGLRFLTSDDWDPARDHYGALAFIYGTVVTSAIALVLAVPVSIGIALFVTQVAPARLRRPVVYLLDLLAVVPSVVFGLWGILVLAPHLAGFYQHVADWTDPVPLVGDLFGGMVSGSGKSFFTTGIILAIMITPIITSLSREVFDTVPQGDREGALALGATRWEMIRGAVLPHSRGGLVGAVMLGLGRAMGETIAAALVIGGSAQVTIHLFAPGNSMPAVIASQFGEADDTHRAALIGLGVALFVLTIIVNMAANAVVQRSIRRGQGA
jgi:phosphate transport system permease protein